MRDLSMQRGQSGHLCNSNCPKERTGEVAGYRGDDTHIKIDKVNLNNVTRLIQRGLMSCINEKKSENSRCVVNTWTLFFRQEATSTDNR